MESEPLNKELLLAKVAEYESFVVNVLQPKVLSFQTLKAELTEEIAEYVKLHDAHKTISGLAAKEQYKTLVDIGQGCHVQAVVEEPLKGVYLHVGLGFFVDLSWPAALAVADRREELLLRRVREAQLSLDGVQADMDGAIVSCAQLKELTDAI